MSHEAAIVFYLVVLWLSVLGIMVPASSRSLLCRRSKQLGAVTFACLVVETVRMSGGG
jgi:predicted secreted protein